MTGLLARACARHPRRTIVTWVLGAALAVGLTAVLLPGSLTTEGKVTNNPESERANSLIEERMSPSPTETTELVVLSSRRHTVDDPAFRRRFAELRRLVAATGAVAFSRSWFEDRDLSLVSPDRHATLVPLRLRDDPAENVKKLVRVVEAESGKGGLEVSLTGHYTTQHDFSEVSQRDLEEGELRVGLPAALIVLVLVFGALVSAFVPLLLAILSILAGLGLTALVASGFELSVFVVNMLTGMGLALGIDYSLFVLSRYREERSAGREPVDAIATAGATASRAVLFSGSAFVVAMAGLLLVPSSIMRSLAVGAIVVGIVSVIAALTLLPAMIGLLGDRVNALRVPVLGRSIAAQSGAESRAWGVVVGWVLRRPAVSLAAAVALLLAAASPLLGMRIGAQGIATLPDGLVSKRGYLALERFFPAAGAEPAQIVVDGAVSTPAVQSAIGRLIVELGRDRDFGTPAVSRSAGGDLAVLTVPVAADALSDRAVDAVERLRSEHIPSAFADSPARALVTGLTAENIDYFEVMRDWLPVVFVFVLALSFVLLTVAFRSIVVSASAIVLNLLSVGAAYGLLVLVFQHGVAAGLFGFQQVDTIEAWVPLFLFAVLFGLSMDYQVFLLSRIRERYSQSGETTHAVTFGITSTARLITGAALIIVAVFAGFAAGDLVMFQQMGFGVAVALLLDATIVRSVLVPATMALLGDRNWYLPSWLRWLPRIEVEARSVSK